MNSILAVLALSSAAAVSAARVQVCSVTASSRSPILPECTMPCPQRYLVSPIALPIVYKMHCLIAFRSEPVASLALRGARGPGRHGELQRARFRIDRLLLSPPSAPLMRLESTQKFSSLYVRITLKKVCIRMQRDVCRYGQRLWSPIGGGWCLVDYSDS